LYVNRLAFAKHPELAVQVCTQLRRPLKVVGTGKMMGQLQQMAGPTIEFLGAVTDAQLVKLYAGAKALLYPVEDEDFGIVPVEAMGYGVPVIAHHSGGPLETIIDGQTGIFFTELSVAGLTRAIKKFGQLKFSRAKIHQQAKKYSTESFQKNIELIVRQQATVPQKPRR
jgi:glycosyltransferase involved in cell wall biosynthesis